MIRSKTPAFLMLLVLLLIATAGASAQKLCSKKSDGVTVILDVRNETHNDITVSKVDENCNVDLFSGERIEKGKTMQISSYKDAAFRVEEAGKARFLVEFAVNPSKSLVIVKTNSDGSNPKLVSAAREDNGTPNTEATQMQQSENKTANAENSSQESSVPALLFKEEDKKNCSPPAPGKKIQLKWKNASKDYAMGFILINSDCEARGSFQRIAPGKTFTGDAYEGQVLYVIEHIDSDENYKSHIKIDRSNATKTFGK